MINTFKEFRDVLSERLKSPFVGSYIITWLFTNWKLIFIVLNIGGNTSLYEVVYNIESYLESEGLVGVYLKPILYTLVILAMYVILNTIGLSIKLTYDNWLSPYVQKFLNNKNIITKELFDFQKIELHRLNEQYKKEKEDFVRRGEELRNFKDEYDTVIANHIPAKIYSDLSSFFSLSHEWRNNFEFKDGKKGFEEFQIEGIRYVIKNGRSYTIENIRASSDGLYLSFDKIVDGKRLHNKLVKDNVGNYKGIENNDTNVAYTHKISI